MNQKWLNYHHLYYFKVIATTGSIAKASEVLLVGQPALSSRLKQLETALGKGYLSDEIRGYLTEAGELLSSMQKQFLKKSFSKF